MPRTRQQRDVTADIRWIARLVTHFASNFRPSSTNTDRWDVEDQDALRLEELRAPHPNHPYQPLASSLISQLESRAVMKFSHSLLFSTVPEWQSYYIAYDSLKSAIYRLEKEALHNSHSSAPTDLESSALLSASVDSTVNDNAQSHLFRKLLDKELEKITTFYDNKEKELLAEVQTLEHDIEKIEKDETFMTGATYVEDDDDDSDEDAGATTDDTKDNRLCQSKKSGSAVSHQGDVKRKKVNRRISMTGSVISRHSEDDPHRGSSNGFSENASTLVPETMNSPQLSMPSRRRSGSLKQSGILQRRLSRAYSTASYEGPHLSQTLWTSRTDYAIDARIMMKRRITDLYTLLSELKTYVDVNRNGFRKIIKKFDKVTDHELKDSYMKAVIEQARPFTTDSAAPVIEAIETLMIIYSNIVTRGDKEMARKQLKTHLREHVVWERNTVWREMIGMERRGWGANRDGSGVSKPILASMAQMEVKDSQLTLPSGKRLSIPWWINKQSFWGVIAVTLLIGLTKIKYFDQQEERNCLGLLAFVTVMWAAEVIPLFVTSLMVPFLVVVMRIIKSPDGSGDDEGDDRLSAHEATRYIFAQMLSPTVMLLIGGFALAAALSKYNIDKVLASKVLGIAGTKPSTVLLAYMGVACFASMWISNVAAPVLCFSLIQPILRTIPTHSNFSKSLILGIALASNIGGESSPISSPQNLIALQYMDPPITWLSWFAIAIPVSAFSIIVIWLLLLWSYGNGQGTIINPVRQTKEPFTWTQHFVLGVAGLTIVLWCIEHYIESVVGDMAVIALIPLIVFFGSGLLRKSDFDNFPWSIVFLAMGGIALGKAVLSSGLLADIDILIVHAVDGLDLWPILAVFCSVALVIATFVSHTVAAVLLVPLAAQIGEALEVPHPRLLIMATALVCSCGAGLPVSGFPNQTAINLEDDIGIRYLDVNDFLKNGIPASILGLLAVLTVGYLLMLAVGL